MKSNTRTRKLALSAMLSAVSTALLCFAAVLPSGRAAMAAIAGLVGVLTMIHCGGKWAVGVYVVSAVLSLLLSPVKIVALMYAAFFGYYPALKSPIERIRNRWIGWVLKFGVLNLAAFVTWFVAKQFFPETLEQQEIALWILWVGVNAVFVIYDICLTQLIQMYIKKIALRNFK